MSNKIKIFIISIILVGTLAPVMTMSAQGTQPKPVEYHMLAPIPEFLGTDGSDVTTAETFIPGLVKLMIAISTALAVLVLIFAGIKYMSTDAFSGKDEAKGLISNALYGLLLAISAWLILYTVNPKLVNFNLSITQQELGGSFAGGGITGPSAPTGSSGIAPGAAQGSIGLTQQQVNDQFVAGQVKVDPPMLLLTGLRQGTVDEVVSLKQNCGCDITITSATSGTHSTTGGTTHANGYKVDVRLNNDLTNYITSKYTEQTPRSNGDRVFKSPDGTFYALEVHPPNPPSSQWGPHWDVTVPGT